MTGEREERAGDAEFAQQMWALLVGPDSKTKDSEVADFSRLVALARRGAVPHPQDDTILIDGTPFSRRWLAEQAAGMERDAVLEEAAQIVDRKRDAYLATLNREYADRSTWQHGSEEAYRLAAAAIRARISVLPPPAARATIAAYLREHVALADTKLDSAEADRLAEGIASLAAEEIK